VASFVFLLVFASMMLAAFFVARSRGKHVPVQARARAAAGLAEFEGLVERETGTRLAGTRLERAEATIPPEPGAAEPARRPKQKPKAQPRSTGAAPESLPALAPLDAVPALRRRRALPALAALAPLKPHAPLAPRAVRSP